MGTCDNIRFYNLWARRVTTDTLYATTNNDRRFLGSIINYHLKRQRRATYRFVCFSSKRVSFSVYDRLCFTTNLNFTSVCARDIKFVRFELSRSPKEKKKPIKVNQSEILETVLGVSSSVRIGFKPKTIIIYFFHETFRIVKSRRP